MWVCAWKAPNFVEGRWPAELARACARQRTRAFASLSVRAKRTRPLNRSMRHVFNKSMLQTCRILIRVAMQSRSYWTCIWIDTKRDPRLHRNRHSTKMRPICNYLPPPIFRRMTLYVRSIIRSGLLCMNRRTQIVFPLPYRPFNRSHFVELFENLCVAVFYFTSFWPTLFASGASFFGEKGGVYISMATSLALEYIHIFQYMKYPLEVLKHLTIAVFRSIP